MCLILFAWQSHAKYDFVLAANRDEYYERPTQVAEYWVNHPEVVGGIDLVGGGTWIGMTKSGRFAALTNYRNPKNIDPNAASRGQLTKDFLIGNQSPKVYLNQLKEEKTPYNGFNLLLGDSTSLWYYNNINYEIRMLLPGVYGLSNALLDSPWPKIKSGKLALKTIIAEEDIASKSLFDVLQNKQIVEDYSLPSTGVPLEMERMLSPLFISSDNYGTRCSTMILKSKNTALYCEETYPHIGQSPQTTQINLPLHPSE